MHFAKGATIFNNGIQKVTTCLIQWLVGLRLTAIQEVLGSIPGYALEIFLEVQGLERGPPCLVRPIGQLLDMRSSEIRLRKLKLRLGDSAQLTTRPSFTAIWQEPLQQVLDLRNCNATDLILIHTEIIAVEQFVRRLVRDPVDGIRRPLMCGGEFFTFFILTLFFIYSPLCTTEVQSTLSK